MLPRQREARIVVVEDRGRPRGRAVTHLALLRKIHRGMIRVVRALIILLMAGVAGRRRQVVVPAFVAIPTLHLRMCPGERKRRLRMVKRCRLPACSRMAHLALLRNACRRVIRIAGLVVIVDVASYAGSARQLEVAVFVALIARQIGMPARQRKSDRIMIECCRRPTRRRVTVLAGLGEPQRYMVRIARLLEVAQVTPDAGGGGQVKVAAFVALIALQVRVPAGQRKADRSVIEVHPEPVVDVVALLALGWELGRQVIRRVGLLIRLLVTRITLRRESLELPDRSALVAVRTVQPGVAPN